MTTSEQIRKRVAIIHAENVRSLEETRDSFLGFLDQDYVTDDIRAFVARVLAWQGDVVPDGRHMLWSVFCEVFDVDGINFMSSLSSFVGNELLDDSTFDIEWRRTKFDKNKMPVWANTVRGIEEYLSTSDDPMAEPVVVRCSQDQGSQDVKLLLEMMNRVEISSDLARQERRRREHKHA